jgi:hypothetical protein
MISPMNPKTGGFEFFLPFFSRFANGFHVLGFKKVVFMFTLSWFKAKTCEKN